MTIDNPKNSSITASLAIIGLLTAPAAWAQTEGGALNPILEDRFTLRIGAYFENVDSAAAKFNPDLGLSGKIDLERAGLDDDDASLFIDGRWRFADRWHLGLSYYGTDRSGSSIVAGDIEFGDLLIPVDGVVDSSFQADIYVADIGYSFIKTPRSEFGVRLGLHAADLDVGLIGRGTVGPVEVELGSSSTDTLAPLPNIGLFGAYAFTPQLSVSASLGYLTLSYDKFDGEIKVASAALDYRFSKNFGVGLGYSFLDLNLDVDEPVFDERYELEYRGPVLFLSAGF